MLNSPHCNNLRAQLKSLTQEFLAGDWLVLIASILCVIYLFQTLWTNEHAAKVQIRLGDKIYATYSLNQQREIHVHGKLGDATISIAQGKARFSKSPCHTQYCVHQGWLTHAGQAAICLPNQISLELLGETKPYDTLNY
ncbi:NusG domain II-containing protein [Methylotenera sp.]|uniref:NusG domain II-containing protein n=1 Tax=Methylotenera sp. TaxID=2051956 RepID=UPI0024872A72|nr:NusG domain II-containing protein [Methylotenera sp.]MDI1360755.1 NusG domain II-containing protein [Methylotenera sp.]